MFAPPIYSCPLFSESDSEKFEYDRQYLFDGSEQETTRHRVLERLDLDGKFGEKDAMDFLSCEKVVRSKGHVKFTKILIESMYSYTKISRGSLVRDVFKNNTKTELLYDSICNSVNHIKGTPPKIPELTMCYVKAQTEIGTPFIKLYLCFGNVCFSALKFPYESTYNIEKGFHLFASYSRNYNDGIEIVPCPGRKFRPNMTTLATCNIVQNDKVQDTVVQSGETIQANSFRKVNIDKTEAFHIAHGAYFRPGFSRKQFVSIPQNSELSV